MLTISRARANRIARFVVGSISLLPAAFCFACTLWGPALLTLLLSLQEGMLRRLPRFVGLDNYLRLGQDPVLGPAVLHSVEVALVRLAAILLLPALIGWLWSRARPGWRLGARLALGLPLALSAPVALSLLWRLAVLQSPPLRSLILASDSWLWISYLALEFIAFLSFGGALAATALLMTRPQSTATKAVLALAAILALSSGLDTFSLPYAYAGSASQERIVTLALYTFHIGFRPLGLWQGAAVASLLLIASVGLALLFSHLVESWNLRLVPVSQSSETPGSAGRLLLGALAVALLGLPAILLYLWGAGFATLYPDHPLQQVTSALQPELALLNGALVPLLAVVLVQLPATYLAALSLTLVRPFGERGSRLVSTLFLASGFIPSMSVGLGLLIFSSNAGLHDTLPALGLPLIASAASLFIFRLYFAGQRPALAAAQRAGLSPVSAFFRISFLPSLGIAVLAGAVALLLSGQSLLWPLIALFSSRLYPLSLRLLAYQALQAAPPAFLAAGAWLVATCWAVATLLAWWPLQALLQRFALVAGQDLPE